MTTDDVEDVLDLTQTREETQLSASPPKYKLMTICNKEARTSLTLTFAHGKHVFALAVITSVQENTLLAETVESIQKDEKNSLSTIMMQEMALAVELIKHASSGITTLWTETSSPLGAAQCRNLCKSPSGPPLDPMDATAAKMQRLG